MIIYLDGPNESRKTTMAKIISEILDIPVWERAPYLPHHGKEFHNVESWWYIEDELKTIELFKKMSGNVIIDRHPLLSEKVFSKMSGRQSPLSNRHITLEKNEILLILYLEKNSEYEAFIWELRSDGLEPLVVGTKDFEKAVSEIIKILEFRGVGR